VHQVLQPSFHRLSPLARGLSSHPMAQIHCAPATQTMAQAVVVAKGGTLGINIEEMVYMTPKGQAQDKFFKDHVEIMDLCKMMMCPCCCLKVPYVSHKNK